MPEGHAYVQDDADRVTIHNFDYLPLVNLHRDIIHLDWDTAVSPEMLRKFATYARLMRNSVIVSPQRLYPGSLNGMYPRNLVGPQWNVYQETAKPPYQRECSYDDFTCHYCGFGLIYLPHKVLEQYAADCPDMMMDDYAFTSWYHKVYGEIPIMWDVTTVHVNHLVLKEV